MKRISFVSLVSSALLFVSGAVYAQDDDGGRFGIFDNMYASVNFGQADYDISVGDAKVKEDTKDSSLGFALGFLVSENVGVEVGYQQFGEAKLTATQIISGTAADADILGFVVTAAGKGTSLAVEGKGWTLGGSAMLPVSDKFVVGIRGGLLLWDYDATVSCVGTGDEKAGSCMVVDAVALKPGSSSTVSDDDSDIYWGISFSYAFDDSAAVGLGYSGYKMDDIDITDLSLNLSIRF